ncbi:MAG: FHA domain-containing protein [Chloroflexota bacterium]|jgi:predicted component of type VI protein secretion system
MPARYQLVLKSGANAGLVFQLEGGEISIGRETSNMVVINDPEVSRKHVRLFLQGDSYLIEDLGSTNGTSVEGERLVSPHVLQSGQLITLGENTHLLFESTAIDPDATVASLRSAPGDQPDKPVPSYDHPITAPPQVQPKRYAGQVPESPPVVGKPAKTPKKGFSVWVIVLIFLVVFLACGCLAFLAFDAMNLYCTSPFNSITNLFIPGACPP